MKRCSHIRVQAALSVKETAILRACIRGVVPVEALLAVVDYSTRTRDFTMLLRRILADESLEMTVPDKPRSPLQKYRLTGKGRAAVAGLKPGSTET